MSLEYAERRIAEALKHCGGNAAKARQQIIAWTYEDPKLLHALAKPHLSGIVAYNIERVASGRAEAARKQTQEAKPEAAAPQRELSEDEKFGLEILKAVANSSGATFGFEDLGGPRKGGVSQDHINAIKAMASKNKTSD